MATSPPMLREPVVDRRAWTARTIDDPDSWYYPLPVSCLSLLDQAVRSHGNGPRPVTEGRLPEELADTLAGGAAPALDALESGRGFAILKGVPPGRYSPREFQVAYWLVGQALGR